jgi:hypothetical protein
LLFCRLLWNALGELVFGDGAGSLVQN